MVWERLQPRCSPAIRSHHAAVPDGVRAASAAMLTSRPIPPHCLDFVGVASAAMLASHPISPHGLPDGLGAASAAMFFHQPIRPRSVACAMRAMRVRDTCRLAGAQTGPSCIARASPRCLPGSGTTPAHAAAGGRPGSRPAAQFPARRRTEGDKNIDVLRAHRPKRDSSGAV